MANKKKVSFSGEDLAEMRRKSGLNQLDFWQRFGITQSGGSRYESGRSIPKPTRILMALYFGGRINDADLAAARKSAGLPAIAKSA